MPHDPAAIGRVLLLGCGILRKEIRHLIARNRWPVDTFFLPSGLHTDFGKLRRALDRSLAAHGGRRRVVFYGACHPLMDRILAEARTVRTPGQNCVDIYLGHEVFTRELERGAFFLFEDWALHWDRIVGGPQGLPPAVMREIFSGAHSCLLCIRTPCSDDFSVQAEDISRRTRLELKWLDAGLDHLERTLGATIDAAAKELP
jgi:hypothetical protein